MSAGNASFSGRESRLSTRFRVESLSYIDLGPGNGGMVIGVSEGGLSFQGVQPLEEGQQIPIYLRLPEMNQFLRATAQIVWLNAARKGGGLRFVGMPDKSRILLRDWLTSRGYPKPTEEVGTRGAFKAALSREILAEHRRQAAPEQASVEVHQQAEHSSAGTPQREASKLLMWLLICAAFLAILGTSSFLVLHARSARELKVLSQSGDSSLGLKLERQGRDWQVSWNRNADSVLKAIGGHLSITDGQSRKDLDLEPSELRGGSILYTPVTNDLLVRLQLVGGNTDTPASESMRILGGGATPPLAEKTADRILPRNTDATAGTGSSGNLPSLRSQSSPPRQLIALDLKTPQSRGGSAAPSVPPEIGSQDSAVPPDAGESASPVIPQAIDLDLHSAPAAPQPGLRSASSGGISQVTPAQLISGREPAFPETARGVGISGSVTVHFHIEKDGRVSGATVVKGNPILGRAAVDAVLGRRYRPAEIAGVPVASESDAVFVFNPK